MKSTFNILLVVGCFASITVTSFFVLAEPAGIPAVATTQLEASFQSVLSSLITIPFALPQVSIIRQLQLKTRIPERSNNKVMVYFVQQGDSPWSSVQYFSLQPETSLWGNNKLNDAAGILE